MFKNGEKIREFSIKMMSGKGGMGTIYYAIDTSLDREVALKEIHPQYSDNATLMERFKIEAMTQAKMNHPNIVTVYSFINVDEKKLIVMEFVKGKSLKELMETKRILTVPVAIIYMKQVLEALKYAHKHNIVHRDIKPGNILIDEEENVKISDFGIAKIFGGESLTKTGMLIGTPWYTSPEQILGEEIDFRSDLYSAGVTFYEMLTGKLPFETDTNSDFQIQQAHLETPPIRPSIFNSEIGSKVEKFILKALAKKKKKRYQNAEEMIKELEEIERNISKCTSVESGPRTEISQVSGKKSGKKKGMVFGLVFFILIAIVFSVYFLVLKPSDHGSRIALVNNQEIGDKKTDQETAEGNKIEESKNDQGINESKKPDPSDSNKDSTQILKDSSVNEDAKEKLSDKPDEKLPRDDANKEKKDLTSTKDKEKKQGFSEKKKPVIVPKNKATGNKAGNNKKKSKPKSILKKNNTSTKTKPKTDSAEKITNIEQDIFYINSEIAKTAFTNAEERVNKLLKIRRSPRLLNLAGKIKFFQTDYQAAIEFWKETLEKGGEIKLQMYHKHGSNREGCTGFLYLKTNLVRFKTRTPGHSFVLSKSRFKGAEVQSKGIEFSGNMGTDITKSVLGTTARKDVARKERLIRHIIITFVMVDK